ncbi:MAG: Phosphomannomutase/phosphoglucomutase [Deltaproteobacteria bacterium ADurb.BinA179]|nr:phosphomannomutase/phosphoglucomutase [Deltaproteobacteria bacterium]OPZ25353.1 MAG: Phosphomannomutase/phosphoglucomutase [Deltaproteobacteria bacterium ADurb.BinA179]NMD41483.1 phosphomannomutase/phosphoglucomutase [Deltaproteobacteria bacterium]HOC74898.1 phosphomannomutase/phosphoglucomutase [Deltaproteobacteria bacterium]HOY76108.1 phosphomannomutase/phosphoglucomutase [Deltaproteobacteria bacterium]
MNPEVFREYDIRGVVGTDLDDGFVDGLARALGVYFRERGVVRISLGMDARLSSPGFRDILKKGLAGCGVQVIDLGMVPTPVMYFSLFRLDVGGGVCVTGSHNPPDNNGFKIALGKMTIYGSEIQKIRAIMEEGRTVSGKASCSSCDIVPEYIDDIITRIRPGTTRLKVVVDPGNGVGGAPAMAVCNALGMEVSGICLEPDGRFPNHHPDPTTTEGLSMLRTEVIRQGADLGIGYDGDADRIGVIDARGNTVYGDMITAILARELLKDKPGEKIIGEVKCSKAFYDEVTKAGGVPIMGKVGHSPMKARLMEEKAALAGEMSGHIFFLDRWYGFDDAIYTSARLLEILSRQTEPQAVFDRLPAVVNTPEIRIECPDRIKFDVVERFIAYARSRYDDCVDIDGVRFTRGDTWGLVRPSNTQPVIVLRFEARDRDALEKIEADTRGRLDLIIRDLESAS